MTLHNINEILSKISELRAVFVLGHRAVPFIEEVLYFLKEITPLLDEINSSLRESTHSMPHATSQLQSVSQATELATTEILDLADAVFDRLDQINTGNKETVNTIQALSDADDKMMSLLRQTWGSENADILDQLERIYAEKQKLFKAAIDSMSLQAETLNAIRSKMNRIMISLQVQDITSQQIAAVNHVIESIRRRLSRLVTRLTTGNLDVTGDEIALSDGTFDENARYDRSGGRQAAADEIMRSLNAPSAPHTNEEYGQISSQDDIDSLFNTSSDVVNPASQNDIDQLFGRQAPTEGPASQSDIDDLFATDVPPSEPASQSDIDQLFGCFGDGDSQVTSQSEIDDLFKDGS